MIRYSHTLYWYTNTYVGPKELNENEKFDPWTLDIGILDMTELDPPLNVNGNEMAIDVEAPMDSLSGGKYISWIFYQNEENELLKDIGMDKTYVYRGTGKDDTISSNIKVLALSMKNSSKVVCKDPDKSTPRPDEMGLDVWWWGGRLWSTTQWTDGWSLWVSPKVTRDKDVTMVELSLCLRGARLAS